MPRLQPPARIFGGTRRPQHSTHSHLQMAAGALAAEAQAARDAFAAERERSAPRAESSPRGLGAPPRAWVAPGAGPPGCSASRAPCNSPAARPGTARLAP